MRAMVVLLAVLGLASVCLAQPKKQPRPALDTKDAIRTGQWMADELNKSRDFPKGNEIAGKAAVETYHKSIEKLNGKAVSWTVEVGGVTEDGRVGVKAIQFKYAGTGPERLYIINFTYKPGDSESAIKNHKTAPHHFPTVGKPWLAKLKDGDKFTLTGTVIDVRAEPLLSASNPSEAIRLAQWFIQLDKFDLEPAK